MARMKTLAAKLYLSLLILCYILGFGVMTAFTVANLRDSFYCSRAEYGLNAGSELQLYDSTNGAPVTIKPEQMTEALRNIAKNKFGVLKDAEIHMRSLDGGIYLLKPTDAFDASLKGWEYETVKEREHRLKNEYDEFARKYCWLSPAHRENIFVCLGSFGLGWIPWLIVVGLRKWLGWLAKDESKE